MSNSNILMLQIVANGLGDLKDKMVFVGGAVAELYADNSSASEVRFTIDVDCVIEISSIVKFAETEEKLRTKGFKNDTSKEAPICRWLYKDIKVDVMPTDSSILGFTNKWYKKGIEVKMSKLLSNRLEVFIFPPEYYLATKIEAHKGRGGNDLRQSHDFEDIIYILENCSTILKNIKQSNQDLKNYLKVEFQHFLENKNLNEGIESALPYGSNEENTDIILELMQNIAKI